MPESEAYLRSVTLFVVLLNPFLLTVYLMDLVKGLDRRTFGVVMARGALISGIVFALVAWSGEALFVEVLQVRYASFLVFGGLVLLIIGVRMVFDGTAALDRIRGNPEHIAGSIAMPFMIGPGTVNAAMLAGAKLGPTGAVLSIASGLGCVVASVYLLKVLYDKIQTRYERLVQRYLDLAGRVSALVVGSIAADMVLRGFELWLDG